MAKPYICYNFPLSVEDKLAEDTPKAPTKGNGTLIFTFAISYTLTPTLAQAFALAQAFLLPQALASAQASVLA